MSFDRYPKRQQVLSEISTECDQEHLCILFTNQIIGFLKVEYFWNIQTKEIGFLCA